MGFICLVVNQSTPTTPISGSFQWEPSFFKVFSQSRDGHQIKVKTRHLKNNGPKRYQQLVNQHLSVE
jgi:hypothetical protein